MRHRLRPGGHDDTEAALANFALTAFKAMLVLCVVIFLLISPQSKKEDGVKPKAEFMIAMEWPGNLDYDIDIYVRDPGGQVMYYNRREVDFINLERDDRGSENNTVKINGQDVTAPFHEELVMIRGIKPGEYLVNVHFFQKGDSLGQHEVEPFPVKLRMDKLNPTVKPVYRGEVTLSRVWQEAHGFRFTLSQDGRVSGVTNEVPTMIRSQAIDQHARSQP